MNATCEKPEPGAERLHARERYVVSNNNPRVRSLACSRSAPGSGFLVAALLLLTQPLPWVDWTFCGNASFENLLASTTHVCSDSRNQALASRTLATFLLPRAEQSDTPVHERAEAVVCRAR